MSILVVADEFPWPPVNGSRIRIATQLAGLRSLAPVDLFCVSDRPVPDDRVVPDDVDLARVAVVDRAPLERSPAAVVGWLLSDLPRELRWRRWDEVREQLPAWAAPRYDLVWFSDIASYLALHDLVDGPVIVDYDDLESSKLAHRRRLGAARHDHHGIRQRWAALADGLDEPRWRRIEHEVANRVDRVVVCSDLDLGRLGVANGAVVPNAYPAPAAQPVTPTPVVPTLLFIGLLTYPPNIDASTMLATEVLPLVRPHVRDVQLRLVGRTGPEVEALHGLPGVTVVGPVTDVVPELAQASLAVVPVRFGGGTRVKILEAFAHEVAVVTTTVGCEGLDVTSGVDVVVADDPAAFAHACVDLLVDEERRRQVAEAGWSRYDRQYRADVVAQVTATLASTVLATEGGHEA